MEKGEALSELNEALQKALEILNKPYRPNEIDYWTYDVEDRLKDIFGRDSDELKRFKEAAPRGPVTSQKQGRMKLEQRATALQTICNTYTLHMRQDLGEHDKGEKKMDKKRALELLKEQLDKTASLKKPTTNYSEFHKEFYKWRNDVLYIIEDAFGQDSQEYERFRDTMMVVSFPSDRDQYESDIDNLDNCEHAIESILRNQEDISTSETLMATPSSVDTIDESPKIFIAHGGETPALEKLEHFLTALGVIPIIAEKQPSEGRSVDDQVNWCLEQSHCALVFATHGYIVDQKTAKKHPRLNVVDELSRCRNAFPDRIILLLEEGVDLPSNVSGIRYERFNPQCMDKAFISVARELNAFRVIKAVKPTS